MHSPQYQSRRHRQRFHKSGDRNTWAKNICKSDLCSGRLRATRTHSLPAHCRDSHRAATALQCLGDLDWGSFGSGLDCKSPLWSHHSLNSSNRWKTEKREKLTSLKTTACRDWSEAPIWGQLLSVSDEWHADVKRAYFSGIFICRYLLEVVFSEIYKHCQRHNGPEGWVHITSCYTNLDQISISESRLH